MKARLLAALAIAASTMAVAPIAPTAAQAQRDWTRVVSITPEGGYRMGNPNAPVKVVEFMSMTCPHCAAFSAEGTPPLIQRYVRSGRVSFEYRNYILNGLDVAAAMISRCASPANYFALNHAIFASQREWMGRVTAMTPAQRQEVQALSDQQQLERVATISGLDEIAARHGVTPAQKRACFADRARLDRLVQMQQAGSRFGVQGTPTFAINGQIVGTASTWATLEPLLRGR